MCLVFINAERSNYPYNCLDALNKGYNMSGVYRILPDSGHPFDVYCDQVTDGGGWTVFQRRQDGSVNFQRDLEEYIQGFGDQAGEHWLGLEKIHRLTKWADFEPEMRVDLMDFTNETRFEHYNKFYVNGPESYSLSVSDASGSAGDSLANNNGQEFSTAENDTDGIGEIPIASSGACATMQGAWWFYNCQPSHLNGIYYHDYHGAYPDSDDGIVWDTWRGGSYSLQRTEMKTRPSRLTWKVKATE